MLATDATDSTVSTGTRVGHSIVIVASNLELGGAERQIVQIANGLDKQRFEVHVVSLSNQNPLASHLANDVGFHIIERSGPAGLLTIWKLRALLKQLKAVVVHGFLYEAELFTRLAGVGQRQLCVLGSIRNSNYAVRKSRVWIKHLTNRLMDMCVSNSNAGIEYNRTLYGEIAASYRLVRNGVDTDRFSPLSASARSQARQSLGLTEDDFVIGIFASFKAQKNHLALVQAGEILNTDHPNVHYLFVGGELEKGQRNTTAYAAELNAAIENSPIRNRIHLVGKRDDVEKLYPCCDLTALPSWHEGLPNVLLESVASGVPFVATDVSDNQQIADELRVGTIVPAGDVPALASALRHSVESPKPIEEAQLQHIRTSISREKMIASMTEVYLEAIDRATG